MKEVRALILTGYGLNCDHETAYAFKSAGARSHRVHINELIQGRVQLEDFHILAFIGGFSWGDDHGAGVIQAVRFRTHLGDRMMRFVEAGNLVVGICNGFQTLVNLGMLPALDGDYRKRAVALIANDCGNFRNQWVHLKVNPKSPCVFTNGIDTLELPVRHGEGKFYAETATLEKIGSNNQVVLQYTGPDGRPAFGQFPYNPNGSVLDIAGICDPTGRVFGLMPHPEAYNHWTNHPDWTRLKENAKRNGHALDQSPTIGIRMFQNAVSFMRENS